MNFIRILTAASAACLLMGCMSASSSDEATSESEIGEAREAQSLRNVRSGPGFEYPIVYQIPFGTALAIRCYTNDPTGNVWYQLFDGNYMLASVAGFGNYPRCVGVGFAP